MAENIEVEITGFASLRNQLREANLEFQKLVASGTASAAEIRAAAQRAADLRDQLDDANDAVSSFTGAGKFQAVTRVLTSIAGGFTAIQGAITLAGGEGQEFEKVMVKLQGAMALTQGLAALEDLPNSFNNMKTVAVGAFNSIKAAIGATGIGLLVVAIGGLIVYWEDLKAAIGLANEEQKLLNKSMDAYAKAAGTAEAVTTEVGVAFELASKGVISKEEALFTYNQKLGDALGTQTDYNVAEQNFIDKSGAYVESYAQRAQAVAIFNQIAELEAERIKNSVEAQGSLNEKFTELGDYLQTFNKDNPLRTIGSSIDQWTTSSGEANDKIAQQIPLLQKQARELIASATATEKANKIKNESDRKRDEEAAKAKADAEAKAAKEQADAERRAAEAARKAEEARRLREEAANKIRTLEQKLLLDSIEDEKQKALATYKIDYENSLREIANSKYTKKEKENLNALYLKNYKAQVENLNQTIVDEEVTKRKEAIDAFTNFDKDYRKEKQESDFLALEEEFKKAKEYTEIKYKQFIVADEKGNVVSQEIALKNTEALLQIQESYEKRKKALADSYRRQEADEAIADLQEEQQRVFDLTDLALRKERDAVINNVNATDEEKLKARQDYDREILKMQIDNLQAQKSQEISFQFETEDEQKAHNERLLEIEKELYDKKQELRETDLENERTSKEERIQNALEIANGILDTAKTVTDAFSSIIDAGTTKQMEATKAKYEAAIAAAEGNSEKIAELEYQRAVEEFNIQKEGFEKNKKVEIANAVIAAIQGGIQAFTSLAGIPVVGPVLGAIAAAAALAGGFANVAKIKATTFSGTPPSKPDTSALAAGVAAGPSKFASGGLLIGPKHAEGGIATNFGELEGGEYIVNRSATAAFLPLLDRINSMGKGSGAPNNLSSYAEQVVGRSQPIIKTYVVATDVTTAQEANKRIQDIARL